MKKMVLLASMMALAALMLAAAPAFAQQERVPVCHFPPGNPGNAHVIVVGEPGAEAHLRQHARDFIIDPGERCPPVGVDDGDGVDGDGDGVRDRDRDRDGDGFADVFFDEPFIEQEIEQEAESGDVDQDFTVIGGGANSNQTVGIQGTANTGNAQNVIDVVDAGDFVGDFADDEVNVFDDDEFFEDDVGRLVCFDEDGDGENDGGGDSNLNGIDDDLECIVVNDGFINDGFINDGFINDGFIDDGFIDGDDVNVFGDDDFVVRGFGDGDDEFEFEEAGADITMSPVQNVTGNNQVNQAAAASGDDDDCDGVLVWDPWWQTWVCTPA